MCNDHDIPFAKSFFQELAMVLVYLGHDPVYSRGHLLHALSSGAPTRGVVRGLKCDPFAGPTLTHLSR